MKTQQYGPGQLIVVEGGDGSGKATQTALLCQRLLREGYPVESLDFPQYGQSVGSMIVRDCLDGRYGNPVELDPRIASVAYALDRFSSLSTLIQWLKAGSIIILDRYTTANILHQGAKASFADGFSMEYPPLVDFVAWVKELEFGCFRLPEPDLVLYLHVGSHVAQRLMDQQGRVKDGHEKDASYGLRAESVAHWACANEGWKWIECCPDGQTILPPEAIHELLWQQISGLIGDPPGTPSF